MSKELYTKILQTTVGILVTILVSFIAWQSSKWSSSIDSLSQSVTELNTKMQVIVTQFTQANDNTTKMLADHESRLRSLERK